MARASALQAEGLEFESPRVHKEHFRREAGILTGSEVLPRKPSSLDKPSYPENAQMRGDF